jgi:hypothetical protein
MSETLQALEQLLADGWQPIAPPRAYAFGGQNDIRAVQIRLALAQEAPIPLLEALRQLLWREWDPLDVNRSPAAQGEYDGYAFRIWVALGRGATAGQIAAYLDGVTTGDMRAEVAPGLNGRIAKKAAALAKA